MKSIARDAWHRHWIAAGLSALETTVLSTGSGPFLFGAAPGMADVCLVPQIANAAASNVPWMPTPVARRGRGAGVARFPPHRPQTASRMWGEGMREKLRSVDCADLAGSTRGSCSGPGGPRRHALEIPKLQRDYDGRWQGLRRRFTGGQHDRCNAR